jgi:hypothetical protein
MRGIRDEGVRDEETPKKVGLFCLIREFEKEKRIALQIKTSFQVMA